MSTKTDNQNQNLDQDANATVDTAKTDAMTDEAEKTTAEESRKFTQEDMDRVVNVG